MGYFEHSDMLIIGPGESFEKGATIPAPWIVEVEATRATRIGSMIGCHPDPSVHLTGPHTCVNYMVAYALLPDGSKEGWAASDLFDAWAQDLVDICTRHQVSFAALRWDGDDGISVTPWMASSPGRYRVKKPMKTELRVQSHSRNARHPSVWCQLWINGELVDAWVSADGFWGTLELTQRRLRGNRRDP